MDATRQLTCSVEMADAAAERTQKLVAVGGILGAVAAASCCIVPLLLFSLGVSGAWIGNLTRLAPYQPIFVAMTLAVSATATGLFGARAARPALRRGLLPATAQQRRLFRLRLIARDSSAPSGPRSRCRCGVVWLAIG